MEQTRPDDGPLTDLGSSHDTAPASALTRIAYAIGGVGLLGATAADSIAVAGRHTGLHLLGSIELVQACVVLLGGSAMLIATQVGEHASVHILTERLAKPTAAKLARIASLFAAFAFLLIAIGSAWVGSELWNGFERTELLHLPIRWLRVIWFVFASLIALTFLHRAFRRSA